LSSILKALKNLDSDQPLRHKDESWPQKINPKKIIHKRARGPVFFNRLISILFPAVILAVGVGLILNLKPILLKRPPIAPAAPERAQEETKQALTTPKKTEADATAPFKMMETASTKPVTSSETKTTAPLLSPQVNSTLKAGKKFLPSAIKGRESQVSRQPKPAKVIDESRFKIEAIVWSNNPDNRFAVINGLIVRVGESIEGMAITHISRDYVTVQSGEGERRLRFMLH
jgi:hypothetical protein